LRRAQIQVNWNDASGSVINSFIKHFDVTTTERVFAQTLVAPFGATGAKLYVSPSWVGDAVRYTEMSVGS
jgi:hypothetical protein